jgi:hypothetical protein
MLKVLSLELVTGPEVQPAMLVKSIEVGVMPQAPKELGVPRVDALRMQLWPIRRMAERALAPQNRVRDPIDQPIHLKAGPDLRRAAGQQRLLE